MKKAVLRAGRLHAPLPAVLRDLALGHLDAATRAYRRLKDPSDTEALHDFRVALRRLRSLLRAYRDHARMAPKKLRKQLHRIARATNAARDAEVQIAWLVRARLPRGAHGATGWLGDRLRTQRDAANAELANDAVEAFDALCAPLRRALVRAGEPKTGNYAAATVSVLAEHAGALRRAVDAVRSIDDARAIHAARIEGKRLRYLIEPLVAALPSAAAIVRDMKDFQDRLGELCDLFVLAREIEAAAAELATARVRRAWRGEARTRPTGISPDDGLAALAAYARTRADTLFSRIERRYFGARLARLTGPVDALVAQLLAPAHTRRTRPSMNR